MCGTYYKPYKARSEFLIKRSSTVVNPVGEITKESESISSVEINQNAADREPFKCPFQSVSEDFLRANKNGIAS